DARGRSDGDGWPARHAATLRRWPRLWGADRALGGPGELSRPLSPDEMAHLHGLGASAAPARARRRRVRRTVGEAVAGDRPFLAVGRDAAGRAVVTAGLAAAAADALLADPTLLAPALARAGPAVRQALADAPEVLLVVLRVPGGRHHATRVLPPAMVTRLVSG
ncbi:MAG TPA: hypothetical protein VNT51_09980, partial [Miltoncostaeaceae bacterium]|nr:hypothetical protein [Miltoncostaeaceae bacterium]